MTSLALDMIRQDGGTQMRVALNEEHVESCAERMDAGDIFPPVVVFYDGAAHWLADGFHRVCARQRVAAKYVGTERHNTWSTIEVDMHAGTRLDAIRYAIGANRTNGLRRTNADKQLAVRAALSHPDLKDRTDRVIAEVAGVSHVMVFKARELLTVNTSPQPINSTHKAVNTESDKRFRTGVDGKQYPVRAKPAPVKSEKSSPPKTKENDSEQRALDVVEHKRICPMCNGEGYIK